MKICSVIVVCFVSSGKITLTGSLPTGISVGVTYKSRYKSMATSRGLRRATSDDVDFLAEVCIQLAPRNHSESGMWDMLIPDSQERLAVLKDLVLSDKTGFANPAHFDVSCDENGVPLAGMAGYSIQNGVSPLACVEALRTVLVQRGWPADRVRGAADAFAAMASTCEAVPADVWQVEWVAALPQARGKGHARRVLQAVSERGRQTGHTKAQVLTVVGNDPAVALYSSCGFALQETLTGSSFEALGIEGIHVLRQNL